MVVAVCLLLAACGSRRPMEDFVAAGAANGAGVEAGAGAVDGAAGGDGGGETLGTVDGSGGTATGPAAPGAAPGAGGAAGGKAGASGGKAAPGAKGGAQGGGGANGASDVGVTASSISVGNVVTKSGAFGPEQFTAFYYGAAAFFNDLNSRGGVNGRKVKFNTCDDKGTGGGNVSCVRNLVDDSKVFALVANNCLVCDGLKYASEKGVPSVGGLAIDSRDYALPHSWRYTGNPYPQNGKIGWKGQFFIGTQQFRFFKEKYGLKKAAVVYYDNSAASKNAGQQMAKALRSESYEVTEYPLNVALPQYDSAVLDMKSRGVEAMWDSIDVSGNQNLCKSMDSNGLKLKAKVSTVSTFSEQVGKQFSAPCRNSIFSVDVPGAKGYHETSHPEVAKYRAAMKRMFPDREDKMSQWMLDGWASAMWFTDAVASCGANVTRACVEKFLDKPGGYAARGLWSPRGNIKQDFDKDKTYTQCILVSQWQDSAKGWVVRGDGLKTCYKTPAIGAPAPV